MAKKRGKAASGMTTERAARTTPVTTVSDTEARIDMVKLRAYRLDRVRAELKKAGHGAAVLFDPINIRYATGSRNHSAFIMHFPSRYVFIATNGPVILFEGKDYRHVAAGLETIDEFRPLVSLNFFYNAQRHEEQAKVFAKEIAALMKKHAGRNGRLAIDKLDPTIADALAAQGVKLAYAQAPLERARAIKSAEEILCMNVAMTTAEVGMARMREALRPGITENQLWAILYGTNIAMGGEWIDARLMSAGDRANPWAQESSDRVIRPNELVAFDTDMIGPHGYCADISRTWFCGPGKPSRAQRELYKLAYEEVNHNMALVRAGLSFRDFTKKAFKPPKQYHANRYPFISHGIGMCDEWPGIYYPQDFAAGGYDGVIEENMTLCIESYMGAEGGYEGVKLERQVLVTKTGCIPLDKYPFEEDLLA
ncbi:MAG: Xaa-Pro peptidase family protein [Alphaproteobacteria bacterium]